MSNIPDKTKLPKEHDARRKLTDEEKQLIRELYYIEKWAIRAIARKFEDRVCRRTIQFVLFPERDEKLKAIRSATKGHLKYYNREKQTKNLRRLRAKKRKLFNLKTYASPTEYAKETRSEKKRILNLINNK